MLFELFLKINMRKVAYSLSKLSPNGTDKMELKLVFEG